MFELKTQTGSKWVNPDHIVSAHDEGDFVTIRLSDGQVIYSKEANAARIARIVSGGDL